VEKAKGKEYFNKFKEELSKGLIQEANLLEPVYIEWGEVGKYKEQLLVNNVRFEEDYR